jgi:hypothetical protein
MTARARTSLAAALVASATLGILGGGNLAGAAGDLGQERAPSNQGAPMQRMHELMVSGNPGMQRMHERMHTTPAGRRS